MPRYRIPELFLGCFLTVAVFATGMLFERQAANPIISDRKQDTSANSHRAESLERELTGSTWLTKDAAGFFTFALMIVGIGQALLFFFQLRYMRVSMRDATIAANAADLSARAATAIEFPLVRANWMGPEILSTDELIGPRSPYAGSVNDGLPTRFSAIGEIEFLNYGRTPAFAEQISLATCVVEKLPEIPIYSEIIRCDANTIIDSKDNKTIEINFGFELTDAQIASIDRSEMTLWFYGVLTFRDVMDRSHMTGFCWKWGRQNEADSLSYFFDDGSAPASYTVKT